MQNKELTTLAMTIMNHIRLSNLATHAYFFQTIGNTKYCSSPKRRHVGVRQQRSSSEYFRDGVEGAELR